ncbi:MULTISPECIES: polymorphic toxin-type HINT domain-containing protein [Saccharibacillus]|uniref:polymorphic toxin-type HINT domain-containing protein n=1 Tax=Saccharibacillus TaxID=456492 RepID=UPI00301C3F80
MAQAGDKAAGAAKAAKAVNKACNCFTAETKVKTDQREKNIEDVQIGDNVLSKDENTDEVTYKQVTATFNHETDEIYSIHVGDQVIESTYNHPFWVVGKGGVFVKDFRSRNHRNPAASDDGLQYDGGKIPYLFCERVGDLGS